MIAALILAAGASTRMGRPKALLPHRDPALTFLHYLISSARAGGVDAVYVIGRKGDIALERSAGEGGAGYLQNDAPDRGQLSSIIAAIDGIPEPGPGAILVLPVDIPLVTASVIAAILDAAGRSPALIVRACHRGRHGHPVLFKQAVFDELRRADPHAGARAVVRADATRLLDVDVGDPGVLEDVDTPEDYERVFGRPLS